MFVAIPNNPATRRIADVVKNFLRPFSLKDI
jgi:hypothetical protein